MADAELVPSLQELCLRTLARCIGDFEKKRSLAALHPSMLSEVLKRAGSRVSPELLRGIEEDFEKDPDVLVVLEQFWERLCRATFRQATRELGQDPPPVPWRRFFRRHARQERELRERCEERLAKRRAEQQLDKTKKKTKLITHLPPGSGIPSSAFREASRSSNSGTVSQRRRTRGSVSSTAAATPRGVNRMVKLANQARKHNVVTKARVQR